MPLLMNTVKTHAHAILTSGYLLISLMRSKRSRASSTLLKKEPPSRTAPNNWME